MAAYIIPRQIRSRAVWQLRNRTVIKMHNTQHTLTDSMSSKCGHEAQIRDLKSRVSQLEIMLHKAKRSLDNNASASSQNQCFAPLQTRPAGPDFRADEIRRLQQQVEQEHRTKADLMANLKQLNDSHAEEVANLTRELEEVCAERLAASQELSGLQEAFDEFCGTLGIAQDKVCPESLRTAATQIETSHEAHMHALLSTLAPDLDTSLPVTAATKQVEQYVKSIQDNAATTTAELDSLSTSHQQALRHLQETVPAAWSELFVLLNREPFQPPDQMIGEQYEQFIDGVKTSVVHTMRKYITSHKQSRQKLCYRSFVAGDLALFLPTNLDHSQAWAAFNVGAPHYFLDMNGVDIAGKDFVIGRIQEIETRQGEPGSEAPAVGSAGEPQVWFQVKIQEKRKH